MSAQKSAPPKVIVAHPGRQHSHECALGLLEAGMLQAYWTGVPCHPRQSRWIPGPIRRRIIRSPAVPLPAELVMWQPIAPLLWAVAKHLRAGTCKVWCDYAGFAAFDRWAAARLRGVKTDIVICYETAALKMFSVAKAIGAKTVLDAASLHHRSQDRLRPFDEPPAFHERICRVKDREIELADFILTLSPLAAQSYVDAGISQAKLILLPPGVDPELFTGSVGAEPSRATGLRFIYVGQVSRAKGVDLLLDSFRSVRAAAPNAELLVAGAPGDVTDQLSGQPGVRYFGRMPQEKLPAMYRSADCLVLASRLDSFGLVVAEAWSCGIPVIVSEAVGAKHWVISGNNGWVVPRNDASALARQMLWCTGNRGKLRDMGVASRSSALGLSWRHYRQRLAQAIAKIWMSPPAAEIL